jgi:malyl-CoA/(S)-citramalyl-CoA lyase
LVNRVFTSTPGEIWKAARVMDAMAQAAREGKGAVSLDGRLIDITSVRMAESLLAKASAIARGKAV